MSKQLKKIKQIIVVFICLFIQMFTLPAQAVGTCLSDKSDIGEDTKKVSQKLAIKYGKSPIENSGKVVYLKDNMDEIYDEQELYVDRSLTFLDQLNAVGIITVAPMVNSTGYGTAILISTCHVLTNAHATPKGSAQKGNAPVYVSLGQKTCESDNEFLHQDMPGKVIAIGNYKHNEEEDDMTVAEDYAIVRIKNITDVKPVVVVVEYISRAEALMIVGFTHRATYTQKTGLRYPTANFLRMKDIGTDGTFKATNTLSRKGGSGSGLFALGEDAQGKAKVFLAGIHESEGGQGIQTAEIVKRLANSNPKVLDEVTRAIEDGMCK